MQRAKNQRTRTRAGSVLCEPSPPRPPHTPYGSTTSKPKHISAPYGSRSSIDIIETLIAPAPASAVALIPSTPARIPSAPTPTPLRRTQRASALKKRNYTDLPSPSTPLTPDTPDSLGALERLAAKWNDATPTATATATAAAARTGRTQGQRGRAGSQAPGTVTKDKIGKGRSRKMDRGGRAYRANTGRAGRVQGGGALGGEGGRGRSGSDCSMSDAGTSASGSTTGSVSLSGSEPSGGVDSGSGSGSGSGSARLNLSRKLFVGADEPGEDVPVEMGRRATTRSRVKVKDERTGPGMVVSPGVTGNGVDGRDGWNDITPTQRAQRDSCALNDYDRSDDVSATASTSDSPSTLMFMHSRFKEDHEHTRAFPRYSATSTTSPVSPLPDEDNNAMRAGMCMDIDIDMDVDVSVDAEMTPVPRTKDKSRSKTKAIGTGTARNKSRGKGTDGKNGSRARAPSPSSTPCPQRTSDGDEDNDDDDDKTPSALRHFHQRRPDGSTLAKARVGPETARTPDVGDESELTTRPDVMPTPLRRKHAAAAKLRASKLQLAELKAVQLGGRSGGTVDAGSVRTTEQHGILSAPAPRRSVTFAPSVAHHKPYRPILDAPAERLIDIADPESASASEADIARTVDPLLSHGQPSIKRRSGRAKQPVRRLNQSMSRLKHEEELERLSAAQGKRRGKAPQASPLPAADDAAGIEQLLYTPKADDVYAYMASDMMARPSESPDNFVGDQRGPRLKRQEGGRMFEGSGVYRKAADDSELTLSELLETGGHPDVTSAILKERASLSCPDTLMVRMRAEIKALHDVWSSLANSQDVRLDGALIGEERQHGLFAKRDLPARHAVGGAIGFLPSFGPIGEHHPALDELTRTYAMETLRGRCKVEAQTMGPVRIANHSCKPNVEFIVNLHDQYKADIPLGSDDNPEDAWIHVLSLKTLRPIKSGEEILVSYSSNYFSSGVALGYTMHARYRLMQTVIKGLNDCLCEVHIAERAANPKEYARAAEKFGRMSEREKRKLRRSSVICVAPVSSAEVPGSSRPSTGSGSGCSGSPRGRRALTGVRSVAGDGRGRDFVPRVSRAPVLADLAEDGQDGDVDDEDGVNESEKEDEDEDEDGVEDDDDDQDADENEVAREPELDEHGRDYRTDGQLRRRDTNDQSPPRYSHLHSGAITASPSPKSYPVPMTDTDNPFQQARRADKRKDIRSRDSIYSARSIADIVLTRAIRKAVDEDAESHAEYPQIHVLPYPEWQSSSLTIFLAEQTLNLRRQGLNNNAELRRGLGRVLLTYWLDGEMRWPDQAECVVLTSADRTQETHLKLRDVVDCLRNAFDSES